MNILMLSLGDDIFTKPLADVRERHVEYAEVAGGSIVMLCYTMVYHEPLMIRNRFHVYSIPLKRRLFYPLYLFKVWWFFRKKLKKFMKFDLIYTQDPFILANTGFVLRFLYGIPVIVGNHSNFIDNQKWMNENRLFPLLNRLAKWNIPKANACRVINANEKNIYINKGVTAPIYIINTPVSIREYQFDEDELKSIKKSFQGRKVIFWAGRPVQFKNLFLWFDVALELVRRRDDVCFCVAGDFNEPFFDMPSKVKEKNLIDQFVFPGFLSHEELAKYYAVSDLFLHTASYEGFGKVYVEAMYYGLPIISTETSGAGEVLEDGRNGYVLDSDDPVLFADKIEFLLDNETLYQKMSEYNREKAVERFDRQKNIARLVEMWKNTVKESYHEP